MSKYEKILSPFDSIFSMINGLPQGHEKPLKHAFYNALGLLCLGIVIVATWTLYLILDPFIKPLVWALLVGSVLHPIKYNLATKLKMWFDGLNSNKTPKFLTVLILPVNLVNTLSECIGAAILRHVKIIMGVGVFIFTAHFVYNYTPYFILSSLYLLFFSVNTLIDFIISIHNSYVICMFLIGYTSALYVYWRPEFSTKFNFFSNIAWLMISLYVARLFGSLKVVVFVVLQLFYAAGFINQALELQNRAAQNSNDLSLFDAMVLLSKSDVNDQQKSGNINRKNSQKDALEYKSSKALSCDSGVSSVTNDSSKIIAHRSSEEDIELELFKESPKKVAVLERNDYKLTTKPRDKLAAKEVDLIDEEIIPNKPPPSERKFSRSNSIISNLVVQSYLMSRISKSEEDVSGFSSDVYMYGITWACAVMLIWKNWFLFPILLLPILIYFFKRAGNYLGIWQLVYNRFSVISSNLSDWLEPRKNAILPPHIRGLINVIQLVNEKMENILRDSIDTLSSTVVILGLIIFLTCASIFIFVQIYAEAIMLVQMSSNVINNTVVNNPELLQILPPGLDNTVDSILDNAYTYGREGISNAIRSLMKDVESEKSKRLEAQILELFDRLYQTWIQSSSDANIIGPRVTNSAVEHTWTAFIEDFKKAPELLNINGIVDFVKQNIGMMMSLVESVWLILKENISVVLGSLSACISIILHGGTAVLNFILNSIVFLTTLFYLLNTSGVLYKPVEFMTKLSPSNGSRFGLALEQAINGVFKATLKMAIFYGLWTWFIHNLFGVKIVYLPSALGLILGAVPFLGPYWACLPAVLDLWIAQGKAVLAILMAICHFLPCMFVDATIYQEIKGGGHPYLTALAIAGGVFWLGVEGAIIGPLLLCGLFVAIDLSSTYFKETPTGEATPMAVRFQRMNSIM